MSERKCLFVHDWDCIMDETTPELCRVCMAARELAAELRQKAHVLETQVGQYEATREIRDMRNKMSIWAVKKQFEQYEAEREKLEAEK